MRTFALLLVLSMLPLAQAANYLVYIGTYTGPKSQGIYAFRFESGKGRLTPIGLAGEVTSPSYITIHPNRKYLYAVTEGKQGAVTAFSIDPATAKLTRMNTVSSHGGGPCYVRVDNSGKNVLVANYNTGSVAVLPIKADGSLNEASSFIQHKGAGPNSRRQAGPHAHSINVSADNRFAIAADLGLDELLVYKFDAAAGTLAPNDPPFFQVKPGSGPRHFDFHPNGKFGYVISEMGSIVTAMSWDKMRGAFTQLQVISTLPKDFTGQNDCADIHVHPSGKFVYGSNRGHDSIAVFAIDKRKGTLTPVDYVSTQGKIPRNFAIDPTGKYLIAANQNTDNIVVFRIDTKTGKLAPTGQTFAVGAPVCVKFMKVK